MGLFKHGLLGEDVVKVSFLRFLVCYGMSSVFWSCQRVDLVFGKLI